MPTSPLSRYKAAMDRPTALPPGAAQQVQQVQQAAPARAAAPAAAGQPSAGPPDLGTISAVPSLSLERYETALSRPSLGEMAGSDSGPLPPARSGSAEGSGRGAPSSGSGAGSGPATPAVAGEVGVAAERPQQAQQQQQAQQWAEQQQARWSGEPDVVPSDLTATPAVDLSRYAAAFTSGDGSPRAAAAGPSARPPRPSRHAVGFDVPEGAGEARPRPPAYDREPSWHRSRSLAALQSIFEHPEPEEGEQPGPHGG